MAIVSFCLNIIARMKEISVQSDGREVGRSSRFMRRNVFFDIWQCEEVYIFSVRRLVGRISTNIRK